jgi:hypothetical protein
MKKYKRTVYTISIFLVLIIMNAPAKAQNILDVSDKEPKYIDLIPVYANSFSKSETVNFTQWINYTTLMGYLKPEYSVNVQLVSKRIPLGMKMYIKAAPYHGISKGDFGIPTGRKKLSQTAQTLIDNITTSYTGSGRGEGHRISLSVFIPDRLKEDSTSYTVNLIYTLTE